MRRETFAKNHPKLAMIEQGEGERQRDGLELIPSENYVSRAVLEAYASVFTNKYAEGYPGSRYYGGQEYTDRLERVATEHACRLFGADHANVQPHSGVQANEAAYWAVAKRDDVILAMNLSHGGHLSHGYEKSKLSEIFKFIPYGMRNVETGEIDYTELRRLAHEHRPRIILAGASSYPRSFDYARFAQIAAEVNAVAMADMSHLAGMIAAGALPNPLEHGFHIMTTTTHKTLRGPRGALILTKNQPNAKELGIEKLARHVDSTVFPGLQGGPHMHVILAKAVAFEEAMTAGFKEYAEAVLTNAQQLAAALIARGLKLVTGGTDNHLILIDTVASYNMSGGTAETALEQAGLTVNKNVIPDDPRVALDPSGIRIGTPAATTRGLTGRDMVKIAQWIDEALTYADDPAFLASLRGQVRDYLRDFPLPSDI